LADAAHAEEYLPLKIRRRDDVDISQSDGADARGSEVERDRTSQSARADAQHFGVEQLFLLLHADLRQNEVAFVAIDLIVGERVCHKFWAGNCRNTGMAGQETRALSYSGGVCFSSAKPIRQSSA